MKFVADYYTNLGVVWATKRGQGWGIFGIKKGTSRVANPLIITLIRCFNQLFSEIKIQVSSLDV